ncbi:CpsD/CapB family tyrosine-protein kinase [Paenibacillus glycinis]|uniref:non-specific protein-tyrosine kinase n=1 Tax=Paenibacillus glycinis TaxID=2697035 RepID=A0ABW9XLW4_9BACL|nr:CpsD/CapB family tyrosine-protein kinase [Paenibacillus glycinis]NBD23614.1 polysaccharide biosynthesis tyrosine autokinase [Paenibacillus glycinis]
MALQTAKKPIIMDVNPSSPVSEAYRTLRTNIDLSQDEYKPRVITVTSSQHSEGKTTTAVNMAVAFAQTDKKVLLIDAALRNPSLHYIFKLRNTGGLSSLLQNLHGIHEMVRETHIPNLSVLTSGPTPANPSDILSNKNLELLLTAYKEHFDIIIVDTPPALTVSDAQIIAAKSDGVLLIVQYGKVKKDLIRKVKMSMEHVHAKILGVVINKIDKRYMGS